MVKSPKNEPSNWPTGMKATRRENLAARAMWASGRCVLRAGFQNHIDMVFHFVRKPNGIVDDGVPNLKESRAGTTWRCARDCKDRLRAR